MTNQAPRGDVETRLRRLERRSRLLAAPWLAVVPLLAIGMSADPDLPADVVTARSIRMVDDENRVRAELGIDTDGSAGLFLKDPDGRLRGAVIHDELQTALYLMDAAGTIRVGAAQYAHGGSGFALHGDEGKGAAVLYLAGRLGSLTFYDEDGAIVHRTPAPTAEEKDQP